MALRLSGFQSILMYSSGVYKSRYITTLFHGLLAQAYRPDQLETEASPNLSFKQPVTYRDCTGEINEEEDSLTYRF